jgi:AhpC/TSA family protein
MRISRSLSALQIRIEARECDSYVPSIPMSTTSRSAAAGSLAPDFTLPRAGGGEVALSSYRGRPVVLAFLRGFS